MVDLHSASDRSSYGARQESFVGREAKGEMSTEFTFHIQKVSQARVKLFEVQTGSVVGSMLP